MPAAKVIKNVVDRSNYVPATAGVTAFLTLDAVRGPEEAVLVTNQREFLDRFTSNGEITRSLPVGYFTALAYLAKSNQLYIRRVNGAGVEVAGAGGLAATGDPSTLVDLDSNAAQQTTSIETFSAIIGNSPSWDSNVPVYDELIEREVSFFASDGGAWANGFTLSITETPLIEGYETDKAYTIVVSNSDGQVQESFLVSFNVDKKDNYGNNIYFADVIKNSNIIKVTAAFEAPRTDTAIPLETASFSLSGGLDATSPLVPADAIAALDDGDGLEVRLWLNGGYTDVAFQKALVAKAEVDCESFAILTVPYDIEQSKSATTIVTWAKDTLNVNSTQATAPICGWLEIAVQGSGTSNSTTRFVSPDGYVAANMSQMMINRNWWNIVAGFDNGIITSPISVLNRWSQGNLDTLVDGVVNPIASFSGEGIVLWGQRTATPFPTSLDRINVSLLLMFITVASKIFLRPFLFRDNTQTTLDEIQNGLILFGDNLKANAGVYNYRVEIISTDEDKDNYCVTVNFYVEPVKGIEKIVLNQVVVNTGELS